jgi:hypothetical protein
MEVLPDPEASEVAQTEQLSSAVGSPTPPNYLHRPFRRAGDAAD